MPFRKVLAEQESSSALKLTSKTQYPTEGDIVVRAPHAFPIKLSDIILEFAEDLLRHSDTRDALEMAIGFACLAWNLALLKETKDERYPTLLDSLLKALQIQDKEDEMTTALLIDALVEKKIAKYASIHRWIQHYQLDWVGKGFILNITSGIPEVPPRIDDLMRAILGD